MVAIIAAHQQNVHIGLTRQQPINIDRLIIERSLRPRRKLPADGLVEGRTCYDDYCDREATRWIRFISTNRPWAACEIHVAKALQQPDKWCLVEGDEVVITGDSVLPDIPLVPEERVP
jgi:hypothetical protein